MKTQKSSIWLATILISIFTFSNTFSSNLEPQKLTAPKDFFGFNPGADKKLISYEELINYLFLLEKESPMLKMHHAGNSPMGKPMYITFISAAENINNLNKLQEINRELALNPNISENEKAKMIEDGNVFVMATLSMHSNEVGPSQAAPIMAYELLFERQEEVKDYLENVVLMLIPCHNPDGMDMTVEHYRKYVGTPYEGSTLPGVYHKYVGHNNNRDFVALTQEDTKVIADIYNIQWYPQVFVEKHQMGITDPRYFVPPAHDPIAENIDEGIWNWNWVFGSNMSKYMTNKGLTGITQHYLFDDYWPGSTQTCAWKNVIGMLTEAASVQLATPVYVEKSEMRVIGKGLSEYKKSINMPIPWQGGWWKLSDIVRYEVESIFSMLKTSSLYRKEILTFRNDLCVKEVNKGYNESPYFYIIPKQQHDYSETLNMLILLERHGINIYQLKEDAVVQGRKYYEGDYIIPLSQAYRPFIKEVMEKQEFPVRRYTPGGEMIRPYDITSWSLPLHRGIESHEITQPQQWLYEKFVPVNITEKTKESPKLPFGFLVYCATNNDSYKIAFQALAKNIDVFRTTDNATINGTFIPSGSFIIEKTNKNSNQIEMISASAKIYPISFKQKPEIKTNKLALPKIAITESYFHDMDAGWTRFLFDQYGIPFTVIRPCEFAGKNLIKQFDVIIFPDQNKNALMQGRWQRGENVVIPFYHPDFAKGMEKAGWQEVLEFIEQGGIVISWAQSTELFLGLMEPKTGQPYNFPISNIAQSLQDQGFKCPGSLLSVTLNTKHPISWGMPEKFGVFHRENNVFATSIPIFDMDRRAIATFTEKPEILSGYAEKIELLENQPAVVWLKKGKGQVVLFSFAPNFRGSTPVTNKLIFNSILLIHSF
ncbi:MAG: hypothetical protein KGZ97_09965 [Bacteroidetes bacterium]|nr:hypothetical protein [Bacteroidota bacterium]